MSLTVSVSDLSIADPDLFLDPMEFLFEEYEGELLSADNIRHRTLPNSWTRNDALIFPYSAVLELLKWERLDITTLFQARQDDPGPLFYPFHTYSPYFDNPAYG